MDANNDSIRNRWKNIDESTDAILYSASKGIEYRVKAGILIGGMSPLPIPLEIRKIHNYNPLLNFMLEGEVVKLFNKHWGLSTGIRIETKGMKTNAGVKDYYMKMKSDDGLLEGVWTGDIETKVNNYYLTLPMLAVWKPSLRWEIKSGTYISFVTDGNFHGYAYNGYLREGSPIGEKIDIENAMYDFSSDLRKWSWGIQAGVAWRAFPHLLVGLDFTWGINSIFKKDFYVMTQGMYPIYASVNFSYAF
jgi:hypothetical protein